MNQKHSTEKIVGYDASAYAQREKGYSPNPIRDAVWELVSSELKGNVLDAGSGEGGWVLKLKQSKALQRIICTDIVDDGASQIEGVEFHIIDISHSSLPCLDKELDYIFAIEVIEHLANPRHFVIEAYRSLKDNGKLLITTPCNESLRAKLTFLFKGYFPQFNDHCYYSTGHISPMTEIDLSRMSREAGFKQIDFYYPLSGRIPKTEIYWREILPFIQPLIQGKAWSDTLFAILSK